VGVFVKKSETNKFEVVPIIVAILLMIVQRVLLSAISIPQYGSNSGRFYLYSAAMALVTAGLTIVPMYMGYHSQKLRPKNAFRYLSSFFLVYAVTGLASSFFFYLHDSIFPIRDYWIILFPISGNYFIYGVSCVLLLCSIPYLVPWLNKQTPQLLQKIAIVLTIGFVVLPTLFSKDLWGFQEGKNFVWIFYLFFVGYILKRLNWMVKIKFNFLQLCLSVGILLGLIVLMVKVSMIMRGDASTATRFSAPYSIFSMYYSVMLFVFLEKIAQKLRLNVSGKLIAVMLIVVQTLTSWSLTNYRLSAYWKKAFPDSGVAWVANIAKYIGLYVLATIFLVVVCLLLQKIPLIKRVLAVTSFESIDDLMVKLSAVKRWIYQKRALFYTAIFFYFFTFLQLFLHLKTDGWRENLNIALTIFLQKQSIILLTVMIVMAFLLLLLLLTNRFWYAFAITLIIDVLITVASIIKVGLREEPVFPSDLKMLNSLSELLSMVSPILIGAGIILVLFLMVSSFVIQRRLQHQYALKINWKKRIISILALLVFFSGAFFINHKSSPAFFIFNLFKVDKTFFNQGNAVKGNGPILQFLINLDVKVMDKPDHYSKEKIEQIMKKYDKEAQVINESRNDWLENQTVILNLSESFSDPARVPNLTVLNNPIPNIHRLMKENTSGLMLSVGYGGGTANMEWEGLTGLDISSLAASLVTPYTQLVENQKVSPNLTNLFDEKIAIHPYTASLYRRKEVFEKFGFDKFYYLGSPNKLTYTDKIGRSPRISDEAAYKETLKALKSNNSTSQFIQLSTMQNHMPYADYYDQLDYDATGSAVLDFKKSELRTYMQGLHYTDEAVLEFIKELDKIEKPITFVFYGDHLAALFSGNDGKKYGLEQHETDYFIYNNAYTREQNKKLNKKVVSPSNFGAMAFEQANIKVTPYYALLTKVTNELPAATIDPVESLSNRYNGKQVFVTEKNKIISEDQLTKKQKDLLEDYKYIQYDLVAGDQYSAKWAEQKVAQ
jgi:phosphoglycerol transferase MdoB-like AlkP superfamily enzyme